MNVWIMQETSRFALHTADSVILFQEDEKWLRLPCPVKADQRIKREIRRTLTVSDEDLRDEKADKNVETENIV